MTQSIENTTDSTRVVDSSLLEEDAPSGLGPLPLLNLESIGRSPETIYPQLILMSRSPMVCFYQFLALYLRDLELDMLPPTSRSLILNPAGRTRNIHLYNHYLPEGSVAKNLRSDVFGWGQHDYLLADGTTSTEKGAGTGIVVNTYQHEAFVVPGQGQPNSTFRMYIDWTSVIASAPKLFHLYMPAVYLTLAALPYIRTHSIALYEYLLRQCALTIYLDLTPAQPLKKNNNVPETLQHLESLGSLHPVTKALVRYYTSRRPDGGFHPMFNGLVEYMTLAMPGCTGAPPHNTPRIDYALWKAAPITYLTPRNVLATKHVWFPFEEPAAFTYPTIELPRLKAMVAYKATAVSLNAHCKHIPDTSGVAVKADAIYPPRSGYLPRLDFANYVCQFLHEFGDIARVANKVSEVPFVASTLLDGTLKNPYTAVNLERAKTFIKFFYLECLPPRIRKLVLSTDLRNSHNEPIASYLYPALKHPVSAELPHYLIGDLSGVIERSNNAEDAYQTYNRGYITFPASSYPEFLAIKHISHPADPDAKVRVRIPKSRINSVNLKTAPDRLYKHIRLDVEVSPGVTEPVDVLAMTKRPVKGGHPSVLFYISSEGCYPDPSRYYQVDPETEEKTLHEYLHDLSVFRGEIAEYMSIANPVFCTYKTLCNIKRSPYENTHLFRMTLYKLKEIAACSYEMFYRWVNLGSPRAVLPRGHSPEKRSYSQWLDSLVQRFLRPSMTEEEFKYLCSFSRSNNPARDILNRSIRVRECLLSEGVEDPSAYPMRTYDIRFRRDFYLKFGRSLGRQTPALPVDYVSILETEISTEGVLHG
jgi:hypothetical protein